ncbi:hypothetical protein CYLTODRAFT_420259 [Cylindrobasidium torrendii FP15055 ss-10]|uniref:Uncharacterized protein n=1 Tax=Cylindrobasidium torrendii FP15055 ss-10 TaxID=1314674 RepID=A0A0D7BI88_9AGAR|nr:hypothetical protein CYLTODRAFT_420259 [Cylindrobasidium torrendii FP15055 ss-10]
MNIPHDNILAKGLADIIYALFSRDSDQFGTIDLCYPHAVRIVSRGRLMRTRVSELLSSAPGLDAQLRKQVYQWIEETEDGEGFSFEELGFARDPFPKPTEPKFEQPEVDTSAPAESSTPVDNFDGLQFKSLIQAWLQKGAKFPTWTAAWHPDENIKRDVRSMDLPCLLDGRGPQMLLHNLSCFEEQACNLLYSDKEVGAKMDKMFINASGSGKTRLCFELLHSTFGFYFTCAPYSQEDARSTIGSRDFASMIRDLQRDPAFVQDLDFARRAGKDVGPISTSNRMIACHRLVALMAARLRVFELYLSCFDGTNLSSPNVRRGWLFLQIQPGLINPEVEDDIFEEAYKLFASKSLVNCNKYIKAATTGATRTKAVFSMSQSATKDIPFIKDVPIILDEAQMAIEILPRAFVSESEPLTARGLPRWRPILRETILCWRTLHTLALVKNLIVTGTGLSMEDFKEIQRSGSLKPPEWRIVHETGSFSTADEQWQYAVKFFPKETVKTNGPYFRLLQFRMWLWLRGRHRWTANFIQYLLTHLIFDGPEVHVMFNQFVEMVAGFKPTDIDDAYFDGEDVLERAQDALLYRLYPVIPFERLDDLPQVREYMVKSTYEYFLRSRPFKLLEHDGLVDKLLSIGVGRFTQVVNREREFCITEPLVIFAALAHFNKHFDKRTVVPTSIRRNTLWNFIMADLLKNTPDLNSFEDATALVFAHAFNKKGSKLKKVLDFKLPGPDSDIKANAEGYLGSDCEMSEYRARLVTLYRRPNELVKALHHLEGYFDIFPENGKPCYAGCLGRTSQDSDKHFETGAFITHQHGAFEPPSGVLFPDTQMGPDILFPVRLTCPGKPTHYAWVAVQCKYYNTTSPNLSDAIRSVSPAYFYKNKTKDQSWAEVRDCNRTLDAALRGSLPVKGGEWDKSDSYNLLRVLATGNKDFCWNTDTIGTYSPVKAPSNPRLPEPEGDLAQGTKMDPWNDLSPDPLARLPKERLKALTRDLWTQHSFRTYELEPAFIAAHREMMQSSRERLSRVGKKQARMYMAEAARAEEKKRIWARTRKPPSTPLPQTPQIKRAIPKRQLSLASQLLTEQEAPINKRTKNVSGD